MCKPTVYNNEAAASNGSSNPFAYQEVSSPKKQSHWKGMNAGVASHPTTLDRFYQDYPSFLWGPVLMAGMLYLVTTQVPAVVDYLEAHHMEAWGLSSAAHYTVFSILLTYAVHGFCATHVPSSLKLQAQHAYQIQPDAMAIRSTAALLTELVYAVVPVAPSTSTWYIFVAWTAGLAIYWDAHFFVAHKICHEYKPAYRFFHKMHHLAKEPNCFGAYFVTYQSHIVLEQLIVIGFGLAGLPRNVLMFTMYWGTLGTLVEHSGFELGSMKLPLLPMTFGRLCQLVGASTSWILEGTCITTIRSIVGYVFEVALSHTSHLSHTGVSVAEHDWHHEKFLQNYALSFTYLDKLFGSYHPGREPGTGKIVLDESKATSKTH